MPRETVDGYSLEYQIVIVQHQDAAREPIVFLHHGFGSISTWKDFPARVAQQVGRNALVYARAGCGYSDPLHAPRASDYLFDEAEVILPQLLDRLGLDRVVLFGPGLVRAQHVSAMEDPLTPPQKHRHPGDRQVPDRHHPAVLDPGNGAALAATHQLPRCLHTEMPLTVDILGRQHLESG